MPTLVDIEGFEHQITALNATATLNPALWDATANTGQISFVTGRDGTGKAARIAPNGATTRIARNMTTPGTLFVSSLYLRVNTLPTTGLFGRMFSHVSDIDCQLRVDDAGLIRGRVGTGTEINGPNINDGNWHRIDLRYNTSPATHTLDWQVDGSAQTQATGAGVAASNQTSFRFGTTGTDTFSYDVDDFVLSATTGDYAMGSHNVFAVVPNNDNAASVYGTNTMEQGNGTDLSSSNKGYQYLDEWPPTTGLNNADSVTQQTSSATSFVDVEFQDAPAYATSALWGVTAVVAHQSDTIGANTGISRIVNSSGTTLTDIFNGDMSEITAHYTRRVITAPAGGWLIDSTHFNGARGRVGFGTLQPGEPEWLALLLQAATPDQPPVSTSPAVVAGVGGVPAPTAIGQANGTATPAVVTGVGAVPSPTAKGDGTSAGVITVTTLVSGKDSTDTTTYGTGSFQAKANALLVVSIAWNKASGAGDPTVSSVAGLTYQKVTSDVTTEIFGAGIWVARTSSGAPPIAENIGFVFGSAATGFTWHVAQLEFADLSGADALASVAQSRAGNTGAGITSDSFDFSAAQNMSYDALAVWNLNVSDAGVLSLGTNPTDLYNDTRAAPVATVVVTYKERANDGFDWAWSSAGRAVRAIVEIESAKVPVAGVATIPAPTVFASGGATASPATVVGIGLVPAPTAKGDGKATPAVVVGTGAVPAATSKGNSTALAGAIAGGGYAPEVVTDSPTAYWRFEEAAGTTADDYVSTHDGSYEASVLLADAQIIGNAPKFSQSTTSGVDIPASSAFAASGGDFTLEMWVKQTGAGGGNQRIIESSGQSVRWYYSGGQLNMGLRQAGFQEGGYVVNLADGNRHQLVMRWKAATTKIEFWVDGTFRVETGAVGGSLFFDAAETIRIGNKPASGAGSDGWEGYIDEVAWYAGLALADARILAHYNARDTAGSATATAGTGAVPAPTAKGNGTAAPAAVVGTGLVPAPTASGSTPATALPATVVGTGAIPAATAKGNAAALPAAVVGTGAVLAPTAKGDGKAAPAAIVGVGLVPAATGIGTATAAPATVVGTGQVPAATGSVFVTASPAAVVGVGSVPAATAKGNGTAAPAAVVGTGAVPAPTITGVAAAAPATVVGTGAVPASTAKGNGTAVPAAVAGVGAVPAPTATGSAPATATPATVVGTGAVPAPSAKGNSTAWPGVLGKANQADATLWTAYSGAPSLSGDEWTFSDGDAIVSPLIPARAFADFRILADFYTTTVSLEPTFAPDGGMIWGTWYYQADGVTPALNSDGYTSNGNAQAVPLSTYTERLWVYLLGSEVWYVRFIINAADPWVNAGTGTLKVKNIRIRLPESFTGVTGSVPAPTTIGAAIAAPATVVGTGAVPAPSAKGNATALPAAVIGIGLVPAPTAIGSQPATAAPAAVAGTGSVPAPSARGNATALPAATAGTGLVPAPTATGLAAASPAAVVGTGLVLAPVTTGSASAAPATVIGVGLVPAPTAKGNASALPAAVAGVGSTPAPAARGNATALPAAVAGLGDVPAPTASPGGVDGIASFLARPLNLTATAISSSQIDLDWDAVAGAATYAVMRDGVVIVTGVVPTAYSDTGLSPTTNYTYRVKAFA